ncbi:MAG: hypothetical protein LBK74_08485 [Treponema sp.]|nr:hypothetical protein [Treponema sp.]
MAKKFILMETLLFAAAFGLAVAGCGGNSGGGGVSETKAAEQGFKFEAENGVATIIGYEGTARDPEIPAKIGGKPVTVIGERAFMEKQTINRRNHPQFGYLYRRHGVFLQPIDQRNAPCQYRYNERRPIRGKHVECLPIGRQAGGDVYTRRRR